MTTNADDSKTRVSMTGHDPAPSELQRLLARTEKLELLMSVSKQFNETLEVDKLMRTILERVALVLNAEASSFWMKESHTGEIVCRASFGPVKNQITGMRLAAGTGIVGWVIENRQNAVIFDASKDDRFHSKVDDKTAFQTKSILCVPLIVKDECVGAISFINKKTEKGHFDPDDLEMLEALATSAAIAIKNALLFQSEIRVRELNTLLDISKEISATLNLDRVLLSIVNLGSKIIHFERAVIGILDVDNRVELAAESNTPQPDLSRERNRALRSIMNGVMDSGRSLHVTGYTRGRLPKHVPERVGTYLDRGKLACFSAIILEDAEGKLGIISMEGRYASLVAQESAYVINLLVNHATIAIRNAQLYQRIPSKRLGERFRSGLKPTGRFWIKALLMVLLALSFATGSVTVRFPSYFTSDVEITTRRQTQVTARTDGVVKQVLFKEGDRVEKGRLLAVLDDTLPNLEERILQKDIHIKEGELRMVRSEGVPQGIRLKRLELEKLKNQLAGVRRRISHTRITSTAGGRILTPRPEELLDKQVVKGEIIARIAVGDEKLGLLKIRDQGVLAVQPGAPVKLSLQALPETLLQGRIIFISHMKTEPETQGEPPYYAAYFSSDALDSRPDIRFGMTGVAKINTGPKTLYDMFFRKIIEKYRTRIRLYLSQ